MLKYKVSFVVLEEVSEELERELAKQFEVKLERELGRELEKGIVNILFSHQRWLELSWLTP